SVAADPLPRLSGGPVPAEVELLEETLACLPAGSDAVSARVLAQLSVLLCGTERASEAQRLGARAVELAQRTADPALIARARYAPGLASLRPSAGASDARGAAAVAELADDSGQPDLALGARVLQARARLETGDLDGAEELAGEIARRAARLRTP